MLKLIMLIIKKHLIKPLLAIPAVNELGVKLVKRKSPYQAEQLEQMVNELPTGSGVMPRNIRQESTNTEVTMVTI